jgi:methylated-DNA-[protein]-cysteine S-methyltransferase
MDTRPTDTSPTRLTVFQTAIGWCGLAWSDRGLVGAQLPEGDGDQTRRRLGRRFAQATETAPSPVIQPVVDAIVRLTAGERVDLTFARLDLDAVPAFNQAVYALACAIPPGETRTYGDLAVDLGDRNLARAVGKALGENPIPIVVPCHRVLGAGARIGGFSARGGAATKARLLAIEGARTSAAPTLFDDADTFSIAPPTRRP